MSADLILYAIVAAGLVFWLRSILGTRHGDEKQRHNPYVKGPESLIDEKGEAGQFEDAQEDNHKDKIEALAKSGDGIVSIENKGAEIGLIEIANAERNFDVKKFAEAAQDAFAIIVESFAKGDLDTLRMLLADPVYMAFAKVIAERENKNERAESEIHAIKKAEIIEAKIEKKMAFITIRFTASETSVVYDDQGEILSGHPDKVTEMRDIWVFGRQLRSRDPRWLVHETRGDFDGDNETLPNSDGS